MKRLIIFLLLFAAIKVAGQTTGYLRFDTVKIMKQNGTCELYIINKTKDSTGGVLTNVGGGLTSFRKTHITGDTLFVGGDTVIVSLSGKLDSVTIETAVTPLPDTLFEWRGATRTQVGLIPKGGSVSISQGYGITNTPNPIVATGTVGVDSATLSGYYLRRKDSTLYATKYSVDTAKVNIRNEIAGTSGSSDVFVLSPFDERLQANPVTSDKGRLAYFKVQVVESGADLAYSVGTNDTISLHRYNGGSNIAHFSMVYFPGSWNGYKYYLAYTPYPAEADENPSIEASNDRYNWEVPNGGANPIVSVPTPPAFNSDVHLFYHAAEDRLYCFYRHETAGSTSQHFYTYTEDGGATWATPVMIISSLAGASPSYMYEKGRWVMWDIDYQTNSITQDPYYLVKRESKTLAGFQSADTVRCDIGTPPAGMHPWHPNVIKDSAEDQFCVFLTYTLINPGGAPNNGGVIRYGTSTNGVRWNIRSSNLPYVDNMYRSGFIRSDYAADNGAAFEVLLNPQWRAKPTLMWMQPRGEIPDQVYDTVSRMQSVYSLKTRRNSHYGLPLGRVYLQTATDTLDFFDDGAGGLKIAAGTALQTWGSGDTIRLIRLYNQVNSTGDYIYFPDAPYLKQSIWQGTTAWGWVYNASQTNYGQSFRTNIPQGYTIMGRLTEGKLISKDNGVAYFGKNGDNLTLQSSANIATFNIPSPYSTTGIYNSGSSLIRRNGTQLVTGSTTDPAGAGHYISGAFHNGTSLQDYMTGQITEIVVWDDVPYSGGLSAVENQQMGDYFANADSIIYDTYTDANGTLVTSHTPEIGGSYTASDANWEIQSNTLRRSAAGSGQPTAVLNGGTTEGVVEGTVTPGGSGGSGLVFRYYDNNNFYYVRVFGGNTLGIFKYVAGSVSGVGATASVSAAGQWTARVELVGTTIRVFLNGATTPTLSATDASYQSFAGAANSYGFHAATGDTPTSAVFDNLKFKSH